MPETNNDLVNAPSHYLKGGDIDPLALMATTGEDKGWAKWNVITYVHRADSKGQEESDLLKALFYLGWLLGCVWGFPVARRRELARRLADLAREEKDRQREEKDRQ